MKFVKYGNIVIADPKPTPTARDFALIEEAIGTSLPTSFIQFMSVANGGTCFPYYNPSVEGQYSFPFIYLVGRDDQGNYQGGTILHAIEYFRREYGIALAAVPFAFGGTSEPLILDLTEVGKGRVVSFKDDIPESNNHWHEEEMIIFADSFEEYLDNLCLDVEEEVSNYLDALAEDRKEDAKEFAEFLDKAIPEWRDRFKVDQ